MFRASTCAARDDSLTLHASYGLLERVATLTFNNPHLFNHPSLNASLSGGYSNVQNITTFSASTEQADFRIAQKVKKADNFIYDFQFRRVAVDPNSLEVTPNLIPQLSQPVKVGGPGITYFHDTRDPSPLDAGRGQYLSVQEFFSDSIFGSDTDFNRVDITQSTYYTFGKKKYVFARNLRVGFENVFGHASNGTSNVIGITNCIGALQNTNATCNPIPLPERLYAGGATSHRGFGINDAGPRDLTTGYPVGGSGVVVNTFELRLPPPTLPLVGNSVSFVLFHDMGNVFQHPGDMFKSVKNFHQPNEDTCRNLTTGPIPPGTSPTNFYSTQTGTCSFNYYSQAVGVGCALQNAGRPHPRRFQLQPEPAHLPGFLRLHVGAAVRRQGESLPVLLQHRTELLGHDASPSFRQDERFCDGSGACNGPRGADGGVFRIGCERHARADACAATCDCGLSPGAGWRPRPHRCHCEWRPGAR